MMKPREQYTTETEEWAFQFTRCWRCGRVVLWPLTAVIHHFVRGSSRRLNDLRTTMVLCARCHYEEHDGKPLGLLGCLRLKRRHDPANYDLAAVNRLRGRAETAITEEDVG